VARAVLARRVMPTDAAPPLASPVTRVRSWTRWLLSLLVLPFLALLGVEPGSLLTALWLERLPEQDWSPVAVERCARRGDSFWVRVRMDDGRVHEDLVQPWGAGPLRWPTSCAAVLGLTPGLPATPPPDAAPLSTAGGALPRVELRGRDLYLVEAPYDPGLHLGQYACIPGTGGLVRKDDRRWLRVLATPAVGLVEVAALVARLPFAVLTMLVPRC